MWKFVFMAAIVGTGAMFHYYPETSMEIVHAAGFGTGGDPCDTLESYFTTVAEGDVSEASKYKFAFDKPVQWVDELESVESFECTCTEDISDEMIQETKYVPDSVSNVTESRLVLYDMTATYEGSESSMKGGAIVFQPVSKGWFVSQEGYYEIDGEGSGSLNVGQFAHECSL